MLKKEKKKKKKKWKNIWEYLKVNHLIFFETFNNLNFVQILI